MVPGVVPGVVLVRFDGPGDSSIISRSGDFDGRLEISARESFRALSKSSSSLDLRVVQTKASLFLKSMSEKVVSDIRGGPNFDPVKYVEKVSHVE